MDLDFGLPRQPVLKYSPLVLVVCQLRFPRILGFDDALMRPLQVALGEDFPDVETEALQGVQFSAAGVTVTGEQQRLYRFRTHAKDWVATIAETALSLETTAYHDFYDFIERWEKLARAAIDALELRHQERLGIRYVNVVNAPVDASRQQLEDLVRPELVGLAGAHERTQHVLRTWQEARFGQKDGVCTLQHGYGEREGAWAYTLDFDYYEEGGRSIDLESQMHTLAQFNHGTFELFRWAISDEKFESFEPQEKHTNVT